MELFVQRPILLQNHARALCWHSLQMDRLENKNSAVLYKWTTVDAAIRGHLFLTLIVL